MVHGICISSEPLHNSWAMEQIYCCTMHESWGKHPIVQPMRHGVGVPLHHCTIHDAWGRYTIVQSMMHGECVPQVWLCNPWCMGKGLPIHIVQPITHGKLIPHPPWVVQHIVQHCMAHDPWGRHTVVQPMVHGVDMPLYNP
jgi:hypothetical protein